jgi:glycosyltransferase involved in cell wall biosynthesis
MQLKSICVVVSSPLVLKFFLIDHIAALSRVYGVTCVTKCDDPAWLRERGIKTPIFNISIERQPSVIRDLRALWELHRYFRRNRFDVVHSITPKGGLLAMTAAAFARIPVRVHTFTGQVWISRHGPQRMMLKLLDTWVAARATHVLVDSESQRAFLLREGVLNAAKSSVLGHGSISGVDIERFRPDADLRIKIRASLDLDESAMVFLYLGRLKRDKGVLDLALAFSRLARAREGVHLLIVGPDEDDIGAEVKQLCGCSVSRLRIHGYTDNPEWWLAASDVLCLPSYREGFGTSIIEAASVGLPAIGSRIYGITDAIDENVTGLLHRAGDIEDLAGAMESLAANEELRLSLGRGARERAHRYYSKQAVTGALLEFYERSLDAQVQMSNRTSLE